MIYNIDDSKIGEIAFENLLNISPKQSEKDIVSRYKGDPEELDDSS